jgi:CheY-like chemotaxis protein
VPKILLADDSTHAQRMGAKILSAEGFEVTTVSNGKAAIDSFKKAVPDLVIADVFMPGRNGYEVCQHVKTTDELKHIPVLLIIGAMEPYDPDEGQKAGADGVITKPLESSNLVTTVKGLIEASKHFSPAKPKPKKEKPKEAEVVTTAPDPYAPVVEDPAWAEAEEEIITTNPRQEEIVIPQAISQQPVGMLSELLEPAETDALEPVIPEPLPDTAEVLPEIPSDATSQRNEPAEAELGTKSSLPTWVVQQTEVSPDDENLFKNQTPSPPSWSDLTQLAAAVSEEEPEPLPLPWQTEPDLVQADTTPVEAGTAEGIEHFENLNETISSHAPLSFSALGIGVQPIPLTQPEEEGSAVPSFSDEMILSPADVPAGEALETTTQDSEFDRGFEPITSTVPLNVAPERVSAPEIEENPVAQEAAQEITNSALMEVVDEVPAVPPDPMVEAAVAMVREATEKELAADAASTPGGSPLPAVDPATLEHVIRGVVGELMPQIVAQVKSALKS